MLQTHSCRLAPGSLLFQLISRLGLPGLLSLPLGISEVVGGGRVGVVAEDVRLAVDAVLPRPRSLHAAGVVARSATAVGDMEAAVESCEGICIHYDDFCNIELAYRNFSVRGDN